MQYFLLVLVILAADQGIKWLIADRMVVGQSNAVAEGFLHITYIRNRGAAFSILEGRSYMLAAVTGVLICAGIIFLFVNRNSKNKMMMYSAAMIIGGGIGNLTDRIRLGYVIDFIDFRVFPVFNFADICVTIGCVLLCVSILLTKDES
jgi:signal peptidase II